MSCNLRNMILKTIKIDNKKYKSKALFDRQSYISKLKGWAFKRKVS